jgi:hypothetical protein
MAGMNNLAWRHAAEAQGFCPGGFLDSVEGGP